MQTEQQRVVDVQVHRLGAKLLFDEHGLSPYWGMVSVFDPDLEGKQFVVGGEEYGIETASYWQGKLDDPSGDVDGGLYEYKLGVWMTDEHRDKGVDLTFRPGFPNPEHVDTGNEIESIPSDCPNSVRVQVEATNLSKVELHSVMQALAAAIDLNPDYFAPDAVHEWSSIYGIETYLRIENATAERQLVADDGIIGDIAQFSSGEGSKGEWKWDHEEATGHYEAVALDPDSWDRLLEGRTMPKRVKCYLPQHPRKNDEEDPLAHHKLEAQYWADYDGESLAYTDYWNHVDELRETTLNVLAWAGVSVRPDGPFVEDAYWTPACADEPVEITPNPIPELTDQQQLTARDQLLDPESTEAEFEVLRAMTDGGQPLHHSEAAERSETSTSTVYRAVERFDDILEIENGVLQFVDDVVRQEIRDIVERFEAAKDSAYRAIRRTAEKISPLDSPSDGPSALEQWMNRHGIIAQERYDGLELRLDEPVSRHELVKILRAGYQAAECSPLLTEHFEQATIDWQDREGNWHGNWQVVVDGKLLGALPPD
jgi:predicted DNA-binding protein YlxM (UPF0122 family)